MPFTKRAPESLRLHPRSLPAAHRAMDDRAGQHAIWVNDKYRLCFRWQDGDAYDVEFVDYHP